jgi:Leucine-rich repeat (LRR) protein
MRARSSSRSSCGSDLKLSTLPEVIGRLPQLQVLDLVDNQLSKLPQVIGYFPPVRIRLSSYQTLDEVALSGVSSATRLNGKSAKPGGCAYLLG